MYDLRLRDEVRRRVRAGEPRAVVAAALGVAPSTLQRWVTVESPTDVTPPTACWRCSDLPMLNDTAKQYAYLLGQYLGDGHLVMSARVPVLRIYVCTDYPGITDLVDLAVVAVRGVQPGRVRFANTARMESVQSYWKHWPCLFPQHGPGRKHERAIVLAPWQSKIVEAHPWPLIRGLIHSDGCRSLNNVVVRGKQYSYPRYFFSNVSSDILAIMGDALDRVGVAWRYNRWNSISVAKRASVALMEAHVGPKY
jgi:hypothetical protein